MQAREDHLARQRVTEDDINLCYWTLEPNVIWNVAMFEVPIDANSGESENSVNIGRRAEFNKTLLAFDINNPGTEIRWLDRVYCDQHSDTGWHLRLIKNGKRFESDSSLHCGSRRWEVLRDDDFGTDWADSGLGAGSGLCAFSLIDSSQIPYDAGCISAVGEESNNTSAQICTLAQQMVFSGLKHRCKRDSNHNANQIYFETTYGNNAVHVDEKGHYYRPAVISYNQLRLFCTETRCYWKQNKSSPTQFFIMRSQGLSDSTASIKDAYYTNAKHMVEVYELEASTNAWKKRGFLAYKDSQLYISSKQESKETVGFVIHTDGLVYYEAGSKTSDLVTKEGTVSTTKVERNVLTRKIWLNRDVISENSTAIMNGNIQHVLSVSEDVSIYRDTEWVSIRTTCPSGSFFHQVDFFTDFSDITFLCLQNTALLHIRRRSN